jgi:hypothetical protein
MPQAASTSKHEVAFVTGAAQGIGLATAARLAADGFRVVALDRAEERLTDEVARLGGEGLDVVAAPADVCDRAAVSAVLARESRVDVMVCCAGIYEDVAFLDLTDDAFRRMLDVNVVGTFVPAQEAARRMETGGRIITIASRGALGGTRFAHYCRVQGRGDRINPGDGHGAQVRGHRGERGGTWVHGYAHDALRAARAVRRLGAAGSLRQGRRPGGDRARRRLLRGEAHVVRHGPNPLCRWWQIPRWTACLTIPDADARKLHGADIADVWPNGLARLEG